MNYSTYTFLMDSVKSFAEQQPYLKHASNNRKINFAEINWVKIPLPYTLEGVSAELILNFGDIIPLVIEGIIEITEIPQTSNINNTQATIITTPVPKSYKFIYITSLHLRRSTEKYEEVGNRELVLFNHSV